MAVYAVERHLPGATMENLADAQGSAIRSAAATSGVRYIRSTWFPTDERCVCLFEGPNEQAIMDVNDEAGLPYDEVVPALDLTPAK